MTTPPDNKPKDQPAELQDNPFEAPRGQTPPDSMRSPVRPETDEEALQNTPLGTPISFRKVMDEAPETPLDIPTVAPGGLPPMQPSNTWARPQPVQHDRNLRSWMYFFASICVLVALWIPLRAIYQRSRYRPLVVSERDADSFIAIAYGGISAGKIQGAEEVSRFEFGRQVEALRKAGFNPIGLQDISI